MTNDTAWKWPYPPEAFTAEYWEEVILLAFAEHLLREMERGRIAAVIYD